MYKKVKAGCGYSTLLPCFDFETYSEAGYVFENGKWLSLSQTKSHGLQAVGAAVYAEHPSTEVLSLSYDLLDGNGVQLWKPSDPEPVDLFNHIKQGGLIEAWNSAFEFLIWKHVCYARMDWPELPYTQLRDAMAKSLALSAPSKLDTAGVVFNIEDKKLKDGKRLIKKFCGPRNPTKSDDRTRVYLDLMNEEDSQAFYDYNKQDVRAELELSALLPDLTDDELQLWLADQKINIRGGAVDVASLNACVEIVKQAHVKYTQELIDITGGQVQSIDEIGKLAKFCGVASVAAEEVKKLLAGTTLSPQQRRALEIRQALGSSSVKKLFAMQLRLTKENRLAGLFQFCGADRTGRWSGRGPQPQNLPRAGRDIQLCACDTHYAESLDKCPKCGCGEEFASKKPWDVNAVDAALTTIRSGELSKVESYYGDAISTIKGCLRGLFCAAPGHIFLCSDYSAIEAVIQAEIAGEEWRREVFRTHGLIYEMGAEKMTGVSLEELKQYRISTGSHHPLRAIGKVGELASAYQGGEAAWLNWGCPHMNEKEVRDAIDKWKLGKKTFVTFCGKKTDLDEIKQHKENWRAASPAIVNCWKGLENAVGMAIMSPGQCFAYRTVNFGVLNDILYCLLPSGRKLAYHNPRLVKERTPWGAVKNVIKYKGKVGNRWGAMQTYGGKLFENVIQAIARDILGHAIVNLEKAGYPVVLHVHDEVVAEVPEGFGSVEELESIMNIMPEWAKDWPIRAKGGWRGVRFRKG